MKIWELREQNPLSGAKGCQDICPAGWEGPGQKGYPLLLNFAALHTPNSAHLSEDRLSLYRLLSAQIYQAVNMTSYL